jgi:hypothetical protein
MRKITEKGVTTWINMRISNVCKIVTLILFRVEATSNVHQLDFNKIIISV